MFQLIGKRPDRFIVIVFILALSFIFLTSCSSEQGKRVRPAAAPEDASPKNNKAPTESSNNLKMPLAAENGEFFKAVGWISDDEIAYVTNKEQASFLSSYNLHTGKSRLIFSSKQPIVTAQVSPKKDYLLVHSSPSTYEGTVTVIDLKGKVIWIDSIPSYELSFEWNPYNESEVLISKFNEDWTYKVFLVHLDRKDKAEIELPQPFFKWTAEKSIAYLNWNNDHPSLFAPLVIRNMAGNGEEQIAFKRVFQFSAFKQRLMTITVADQDPTKAIYTFYNQNVKQLEQFSMPQLSKFSDWLVPYYDYVEAKDEFLTFQPNESGDVDTYKGGFRLISWQIAKNKSVVLFQNLNNEPLSCSPSGKFCLYGQQFEKLLDLNNKKLLNWVKQ